MPAEVGIQGDKLDKSSFFYCRDVACYVPTDTHVIDSSRIQLRDGNDNLCRLKEKIFKLYLICNTLRIKKGEIGSGLMNYSTSVSVNLPFSNEYS
jgi:hypothetical protein